MHISAQLSLLHTTVQLSFTVMGTFFLYISCADESHTCVQTAYTPLRCKYSNCFLGNFHCYTGGNCAV